MKQEKGTLNTEKAKVNGAEVTEQDRSTLDQLLEKVSIEDASYQIMDAELTSEIVNQLRGHYSPNLIYNKPYKSDNGKTSWRACDRVKGECWYKSNNVKHIHVVGVGYQGALTAMRGYGRMRATVENMPEITEQADRLYWAAYGMARDGHSDNEIGRWYFEPVLMDTRNGYIENPHGASFAESKVLRNVILALIPAALMEGWIEDYLNGKEPFDVQRAKDLGYGPAKQAPRENRSQRPTTPEKTEEKRAAQTPGGRALASVIAELAVLVGRDVEELTAFADSEYETKGKAMLALNRALNDEDSRSEMRLQFTEWLKSQDDKPDPDPPADAKTEAESKDTFLEDGDSLPTEHQKPTEENAPESATDDAPQDNTQAEPAEGQEQDDTSASRATLARLSELVKTFPGAPYMTVKSNSFKERAAETIGRGVTSIKDYTETDARAIIASLEDEKAAINKAGPRATSETVVEEITEYFVDATADKGKTYPGVEDGEYEKQEAENRRAAWFESTERQDRIDAYMVRIHSRWDSVESMAAFHEDTTGIRSFAQWLQEHFDLANAALDKLDAHKAEPNAPATTEDLINGEGKCTEDQLNEIIRLFSEWMPEKKDSTDKSTAHGTGIAQAFIRGIVADYTGILLMTTEQASDVIHALKDRKTDAQAE